MIGDRTAVPNKYDAAKFYEVDPHRFHADASDLQIPPALWPNIIHVPGIGNEQPFKLLKLFGGQLGSRAGLYVQNGSAIQITIWND